MEMEIHRDHPCSEKKYQRGRDLPVSFLVLSKQFGEIQCDFYSDGKEPWMTRDQIGAALEYSNPRDAIAKIHKRKKSRLDQFSGVVRLSTPGGGKVGKA